LQNRIRDPRLAHATVTGVEVSPDLKLARVYVTSLGDADARSSALQGLEHASNYIRRELAQRLEMRHTPELRFALDESWERGERIESLLQQLHENGANNEPSDKDAPQDDGQT